MKNNDIVGVVDKCKMQTFSGRFVNPFEPVLDDVILLDIAHSLALQCRYGGHCRVPYSVAQHCHLVSHNVPAGLELEGLLHDAAETWLSDLIRPIKASGKLKIYKKLEHKWEILVAERFGLKFPWPGAIKNADNTVMFTEQRDILLHQRPWPGAEHYTLLEQKIVPWTWKKSEKMFLERFEELSLTRSGK